MSRICIDEKLDFFLIDEKKLILHVKNHITVYFPFKIFKNF